MTQQAILSVIRQSPFVTVVLKIKPSDALLTRNLLPSSPQGMLSRIGYRLARIFRQAFLNSSLSRWTSIRVVSGNLLATDSSSPRSLISLPPTTIWLLLRCTSIDCPSTPRPPAGASLTSVFVSWAWLGVEGLKVAHRSEE